MKNNLLKYFITAVFFCSTIVLFAQPGSGSDGPPLEDADPAAPIDNYVWVLAIVGLLFVFMKFKSVYSNKSQG